MRGIASDMSLVLDVCDTIQVLDFGRPVFHGDPVEVQALIVKSSAPMPRSAPQLQPRLRFPDDGADAFGAADALLRGISHT